MKKLITLTALLLCAVVSSWAADATYVPQGLNTITSNTVVYASSITGAGDPASSWVVVPAYSSSSKYTYTNTSSDDAGNPTGITDNIETAEKVSMIQIKSDGNTLSSNKRVVHMHVTGITSVIAHGYTSSSNRGMAIACTEYESGSTSTMASASGTVNRTGSGGSMICQATGLDPTKEYIVSIYAVNSDTQFYCAEFTVPAATEEYTVSFNAGLHGTYTGGDIEEASAGAGITLPSLTSLEDGYVFNGWFTAASDGTKAGVAGNTYYPKEDITLYAQYSAEAAPTIEIDNYSPSTYKDVAKTFTATATGAPTPTVTWYQSETAATSGGTEVGTGLTFNPDVSSIGTFYYYAVASNGVSPDATSSLITLTVNDPDKYVDGNAYYMSEDETPVPDEKIFADDITMQFVNGKKGESFTPGVKDAMISDVNPNFVASVSGTSANNGWKARFTPTTNGKLSVGVIINKNKTFSITNVTSFKYEGKNGASENVSETVESNSLTTEDDENAKLYVVVTIDVVKGTTYDFSVASSKMGFYGFEFTPTTTVRTNAGNWASFTPSWNATLEDGATAYIITGVDGDAITASTVGVLEAGKGYFVKGDAASKDYTATATSEAATDTDGNLIVGCAEATNINAGVNAKYVLGTNGSGKSGLFLVNSDVTVPAGKAYLETKSAAARQFLSLDFDEVVTGIETIEAKKSLLDGEFFNLKGQRVAQPQKGLYILNGKKVVLK